MNCPNCGKSMDNRKLGEVAMEVCSHCGGTWFDGNELTQLKDQELPDASWLDYDLWKDVNALKYSWGERACPVCSKTMAVVGYAETGVMVDVCVEHDGVFLERGELKKILTALEEAIVSKHGAEYFSAALHEGKEYITGEEGRHADWKDFTTVMRLWASRVMVDHPTFAKALSEFALASPK